MPRYRALVMGRNTTADDEDVVSNTLYFDDHGIGTDAQNLAGDLADIYAANGVFMKGCDEVEVRFYDMGEPVPREIQGQATRAKTLAISGPREVALCLSFYSQRNVPRNRGRIYLGPSTNGTERPSDAVMTAAITLAHSFADLGGTDVDWCVFSPTTLTAGGTLNDAFKPVSHVWVDDEWDTQRSRGLRATKRFDEALDE